MRGMILFGHKEGLYYQHRPESMTSKVHWPAGSVYE